MNRVGSIVVALALASGPRSALGEGELLLGDPDRAPYEATAVVATDGRPFAKGGTISFGTYCRWWQLRQRAEAKEAVGKLTPAEWNRFRRFFGGELWVGDFCRAGTRLVGERAIYSLESVGGERTRVGDVTRMQIQPQVVRKGSGSDADYEIWVLPAEVLLEQYLLPVLRRAERFSAEADTFFPTGGRGEPGMESYRRSYRLFSTSFEDRCTGFFQTFFSGRDEACDRWASLGDKIRERLEEGAYRSLSLEELLEGGTAQELRKELCRLREVESWNCNWWVASYDEFWCGAVQRGMKALNAAVRSRYERPRP